MQLNPPRSPTSSGGSVEAAAGAGLSRRRRRLQRQEEPSSRARNQGRDEGRSRERSRVVEDRLRSAVARRRGRSHLRWGRRERDRAGSRRHDGHERNVHATVLVRSSPSIAVSHRNSFGCFKCKPVGCQQEHPRSGDLHVGHGRSRTKFSSISTAPPRQRRTHSFCGVCTNLPDGLKLY